MLYFLLFLLIFDILFIYSIRKTILSPALWMCVPFLVSTVASIIGNSIFWNIEEKLIVVVIIEVGIASMFVGELVGSLFKSYHLKSHSLDINFGYITISKKINAILFLYAIIVDVIFYRYNISLGLSALALNQVANTDTTIFPLYLLVLTRSVLAMGYVYIFVIANNVVYRILTKKEKIKGILGNILVLGAVIVCQVLYTSRGTLISFLLFFIATSLLILSRVGYKAVKPRALRQLIKKIVPITIVVLVIFTVMGVAMGKFGKGLKAFRLLLIYMSGGVISFSLWFDQAVVIRNISGVSNTFSGFLTLLNHFGFNYDMNNVTDIFARWQNGAFSSNVFGCFKPYYFDYGIIGVIVIDFVLGFIYFNLMKAALYHKSGYMMLFISCYFLEPLLFMSISAPTNTIMSLAWLSQFLLMLVLAHVIFKASYINESKFGLDANQDVMN